MSADLHIHALVEPCTEADLAEFFCSHLGSKYFKGFFASGGSFDEQYGPGSAHRRVSETPFVWIGEVSWLKAALLEGGTDTYVPDFVAAVSEIIGEDLPLVTHELIGRLRDAHDRPATSGLSYSTAGWEPIGAWLEENIGKPVFTVSW